MYYLFIASTTFAIVPADLRSAGIAYKDLQIRLKYRFFKLKMKSRRKSAIKNEKLKTFVVRCLQTKEERPVTITSNGTFFFCLNTYFLTS